MSSEQKQTRKQQFIHTCGQLLQFTRMLILSHYISARFRFLLEDLDDPKDRDSSMDEEVN